MEKVFFSALLRLRVKKATNSMYVCGRLIFVMCHKCMMFFHINLFLCVRLTGANCENDDGEDGAKESF